MKYILFILLLFAGYTQAQTVNVTKSTSTTAVTVYTKAGTDAAIKAAIPTTGVNKTYVDSLFNSLVGNMTELFSQTDKLFKFRATATETIRLQDSTIKAQASQIKALQADSVKIGAGLMVDTKTTPKTLQMAKPN